MPEPVKLFTLTKSAPADGSIPVSAVCADPAAEVSITVPAGTSNAEIVKRMTRAIFAAGHGGLLDIRLPG